MKLTTMAAFVVDQIWRLMNSSVISHRHLTPAANQLSSNTRDIMSVKSSLVCYKKNYDHWNYKTIRYHDQKSINQFLAVVMATATVVVTLFLFFEFFTWNILRLIVKTKC